MWPDLANGAAGLVFEEATAGLLPGEELRAALAAASTGRPAELSFQLAAADGSEVRFLLQLDPEELDGEACIIATMVDITAVGAAPGKTREALLDRILELIPYPIIMKDAKGRYVDCNVRFCEFSGKSRADLIGKTADEVWPDTLAESYLTIDRQLLEGDGEGVFDTEVQRSDGELRHISFRKVAVRGEGGKVEGILGVILDTTDLHKAEESRLKGEERLSAFLRFAPAAALMFDLSGRVLLANEGAADNFGVHASWMIGRDFRDLLPPKVAAGFADYTMKVIETGEAFTSEDVVTLRPGRMIILSTYFPVKDSEGRIQAIGLFALDMTARREAERRVRIMIENMPYGVAWRRADGHYLEANAAALDILGLKPGEFTGRHPGATRIDAYDSAGRPIPPEELPSERVLRTGRPVRGEILAIKQDEKVRWARIDAYPITDNGGHLAEAFITLSDVSELHNESSLKDKLIREIHHRVKNNLALVAALLSITSSRAAPEAKHDLDDAAARVGSIADLYELLIHSESFSRVAVDDYLERLVASMRVTLGEGSGIVIDLDAFPLQLPQKRAVSLGLVVSELVTNAIKYAYPDRRGEIRIRLIEDVEDCVLRVEDDGVGFSGAEPEAGTGLSIVTSLVTDLGGSLTYETSHGFACVVTFPLET
jgi:PAS domain S-box-containing protein